MGLRLELVNLEITAYNVMVSNVLTVWNDSREIPSLMFSMMNWIYCVWYITFLEIAMGVQSNMATVATPPHKTVCLNEIENCPAGLSYHCIPDEKDQYKHICSQWKWIPKGRCPYYNLALQTIDSYPCDTERLQGCPKSFYRSHNVSEFDTCYLTLYPPSTPSDVTDTNYTTLTDKNRKDGTSIKTITRFENDYWLHIGIPVGLCSVTVFCCIVLLYYIQRMSAQLKKIKGDEEIPFLEKGGEGKGNTMTPEIPVGSE